MNRNSVNKGQIQNHVIIVSDQNNTILQAVKISKYNRDPKAAIYKLFKFAKKLIFNEKLLKKSTF